MESFKTVDIWKVGGVSNQASNVSICPDTYMAAILELTWRPVPATIIFMFLANNSSTVSIWIYVCYSSMLEQEILNILV